MALRKTVGKLMQLWKRLGIKWLMAAVYPQQAIMDFAITCGGTGTDAVAFADQYIEGEQGVQMADTTYRVYLGYTATPAGKFVATASKTTTGFDITGGGAGEVINCLVIGRTVDMPVVNS